MNLFFGNLWNWALWVGSLRLVNGTQLDAERRVYRDLTEDVLRLEDEKRKAVDELRKWKEARAKDSQWEHERWVEQCAKIAELGKTNGQLLFDLDRWRRWNLSLRSAYFHNLQPWKRLFAATTCDLERMEKALFEAGPAETQGQTDVQANQGFDGAAGVAGQTPQDESGGQVPAGPSVGSV